MAGPSWWRRLADEPGLLGRIRRQWPWVVVVAILVVGVVVIATAHWRRGAFVVGGAMVAGGFFRTILKEPGILAIRQHRWIDLLFYYGAGLGIMAVCLIVPAPL